MIASLVDKSLVTAAGEAEVRYRLLETVRAYAAERLAEAGEEAQVRAAHARYFLDLAEQGEPELRGPAQLDWLGRLSAEHDNFAAALRYAIGARDVAVALRFIAALSWFWLMRDYEAEAGEWAAAVGEIAGDEAPPGLADGYAICHVMTAMSAADAGQPPGSPAALRAAMSAVGPGSRHPLLMLARPMLAFFGGDPDGGLRDLRALGDDSDPWVRAAALAASGHLALNRGQLDAAAADLDRAYAGFTAIGDRWGLVLGLAGLSEVALGRDDPDEAVRILEEARGLAAAGLHGNFADMMLVKLGQARARQGDIGAARVDLERAIRLAERIGEGDDQAVGYLELADLARRTGEPGRARELVLRAVQITEANLRRPGMAAIAATAYSKLGCLTEVEGDLAAAARWHAKATGLVASGDEIFMPGHPAVAAVVEGLAALAAASGQPGRAAELLGLAHTLHGFRDAGSLDVARTAEAAAAGIGAAAFEEAYAAGRALTRADAVALVP